MERIKFYDYIASHTKKVQEDRAVVGFVTISRQTGAGGTTIAEKLASYLNSEMSPVCPWTVFDQGLVHQVIKDHNLSEQMLPFLRESNIPEIQDTVEELLRLHPAQVTLVWRTNETILRLAAMGHAIVVGRGAPVITRNVPGGVHVRLVGSLNKRKEHIKEHFELTELEARQFIKKEDAGRAQYLKKYFDRDIENPLLYDLVINTDKVSYDDAVMLIGDLVMQRIKAEEDKRAVSHH
jgi:cytidylate kinase